MAYIFYLDEVKIPVTPSSLSIKITNQNKTVNLINDGEINLLKAPGLSEVSFDFIVPKRERSFTYDLKDATVYLDLLEDLKVNSKVFQFIVYRETGSGEVLFKTNMSVTLEDYELVEDVDNGSDLEISVSLKQYREYGSKTITVKKKNNGGNKGVSSSNKKSADKNKKTAATYKVKSGDTLWAIAKKHLGNPNKWKTIYNLNKSVIENTAKKHGFKSSSNGHWIFPNTVLKLR